MARTVFKILLLAMVSFASSQETNLTEEYPFFAAIHRSHNPWGYSFDDVACSGGIFDQTKVVTVCSCIRAMDSDPESQIYSHLDYYISLGIGQMGVGKANISNAVIMTVKSIHYHPSCYQSERTKLWYGDIAVFYLDKSFNYSEHIQAMNLPHLGLVQSSRILEKLIRNFSMPCKALAWSKTSPELLAFDVMLLPMSECVEHCSSNMAPWFCLRRDHVSGFMIKMPEQFNETNAYTGGPLICHGTVWGMVNLNWPCSKGLVRQVTSPTELIFAKKDFMMSNFLNVENSRKPANCATPRENALHFFVFMLILTLGTYLV